MNVNDKHDNRFHKTRRSLSRSAIAAAVPLGMLAVLAAAPAQALPDGAPDAPAGLPDPAAGLTPVSVPIDSDGAHIALASPTEAGETYSTGPLEGRLNALVDANAANAMIAGGAMYNEVGLEGDFGEVRVNGHHSADGSADPVAEKDGEGCVLEFEFEHLPGAQEEGSVTLRTAPLEFTEIQDPGAEAFPPVDQMYRLREPVQLFEVDGSDEPFGTIEEFDVIVNGTEVPSAT
ncbi:hypothetical protein AB0K52_18525 [Glycomyces sp. NPDC049804]|uniref:hypothetical protein n=1 Tax=Glycomyces sp. NPDC049804 TaxID=3154363 RepID=UPI00343D8163